MASLFPRETTRSHPRSVPMSTQRRAARRSAAGYRMSRPWRIVTGVAEFLDRRIGWDRLPLPGRSAPGAANSGARRIGWDSLPLLPGLLTLLGLRVRLRQKTLHDTGHLPSVNLPDPAPPPASHRVNRTADGSHNDLDEPR